MNDTATSSLLILARALQFAAGMLLVNVAVFRALVLLPAFAGEEEETWQTLAPFLRRLWKIFRGALAVSIISAALLFWATAAGMSGASLPDALDRNTLAIVLFQTRFGAVFFWRAGFALALVVLSVIAGPWTTRRGHSLWEIALGLFAAAFLASIAWTGHAAASGGSSQPWNLIADALHLVAASVWPAGLLPFALFLGALPRDPARLPFAPVMKTVRRFSDISLGAVIVLAIAGTMNSFFLVGSFPALVATPYGRVLSLKLLLFAGMLAIATYNRWRLLPLLFDPHAGSAHGAVLLDRLRKFVLAELTLAAAVVAVVAWLGTMAPPR